MRRVLLAIIFLLSFLNAQIFQTVPKEKGTFVNSGDEKYYCSACAMSLPKYYKTNYIYEGHQYCSINCVIGVTKGKISKPLKVVDTKSLKFIDAKKAFYVVGSSKPGTMTMNSKYAFKSKEEAVSFQKEFGGEVFDFEKTLEIAKNDSKKDMAMMQVKKEKKIYKMGEKLYKARCKSLDVKGFENKAQLKVKLQQNCKTKRDRELQAMTIYLWDIKKVGKKLRKIERLEIPKDAKCPICGMFAAKYPKWAAMVEYKGKHYYFDGPKDMFKFVFIKGKKNIDEIYVSDYFTTKKIDGKKAFYVMGSDVYGPMGKEMVPFESDKEAYNFKNDHFGKKVMFYSEITDEVLEYLK